MSNAYQLAPLTLALSKAGLTAGTTTTYTTANAVTYAIDGKAYSKVAVTNGATPTLDADTGVAFVPITAGYGCTFLFSYDALGNLNVTQSALTGLDTAGAFVVAPQIPAVPKSACPFGYLTVLGASTLAGSWTFGASNLSAVTGMTYNFDDLITLPARPQVN